MTIAIPQIDPETDNWMDTWTKFNQAAIAISNSAVTVNSNTTIGNAVINGTLRANTLYATSLSGGELGNTQVLSFVSTVTFTANVAFTGANNSLGTLANIHATGANTTHKTVMANNTTGRLRYADLNEEIRAIDGANSGIDSDLLDGQHGAWYADIPARQGYTSVNKAGDTMTGGLTAPVLQANVGNISAVSSNAHILGNVNVKFANYVNATSTAPVLISNSSVTSSKALKCVVHRSLGANSTVSEILVLGSGANTHITEYAIINTANTPVGAITANIASGNIRVYVTPDVGTTVGTPTQITASIDLL